MVFFIPALAVAAKAVFSTVASAACAVVHGSAVVTEAAVVSSAPIVVPAAKVAVVGTGIGLCADRQGLLPGRSLAHRELDPCGPNDPLPDRGCPTLSSMYEALLMRFFRSTTREGIDTIHFVQDLLETEPEDIDVNLANNPALITMFPGLLGKAHRLQEDGTLKGRDNKRIRRKVRKRMVDCVAIVQHVRARLPDVSLYRHNDAQRYSICWEIKKWFDEQDELRKAKLFPTYTNCERSTLEGIACEMCFIPQRSSMEFAKQLSAETLSDYGALHGRTPNPDFGLRSAVVASTSRQPIIQC